MYDLLILLASALSSKIFTGHASRACASKNIVLTEHCLKSRIIKYLLVIALLAVILSSYLADTDWEVSHTIDIDAKPSIVWGLLVDLDGYSKWNRYSPNVTGILAEGEVLVVEAHLDDEVQHVKSLVLSIKPGQELCWNTYSWFKFLANGMRCRWLTAMPDGGTRLLHHEVMQGPLAWLVERLYRERIERGLALVNNSLAAEAEAREKR